MNASLSSRLWRVLIVAFLVVGSVGVQTRAAEATGSWDGIFDDWSKYRVHLKYTNATEKLNAIWNLRYRMPPDVVHRTGVVITQPRGAPAFARIVQNFARTYGTPVVGSGGVAGYLMGQGQAAWVLGAPTAGAAVGYGSVAAIGTGACGYAFDKGDGLGRLLSAGLRGIQSSLPGAEGCEQVWDWLTGDPDPDPQTATHCWSSTNRPDDVATVGCNETVPLDGIWDGDLEGTKDASTGDWNLTRLWVNHTGVFGDPTGYFYARCVSSSGTQLEQFSYGSVGPGQSYDWPDQTWVCPSGYFPVLQLRLDYPTGTPDRHAYLHLAESGDGGSTPVARYVETSGECVHKDTGARSVLLAQSETYTSMEQPKPWPSVQCADDEYLDRATITRKGDGIPDAVIGDYVAPETVTDATSPYRDCLMRTGTEDPCAFEVQKKMPDGTWRSCYDGAVCEGWSLDFDRDTKYRCVYGATTLPLGECKSLAPTYDAPTVTDSIAIDVGPDPAWEDTDGDPATAPEPAPGTTTEPMPAPADPAGDPSPELTPGLDDGCVPKGWDLINPWAYTKSFACALKWAFAPSQETATRVDQLGETLKTKAPAPQLESVATWTSGLSEVGTGCLDFDLDLREHGQYKVFNCNGAVGTEMQKHRTVLTVAVYGSFLLPLAWWGWRTYAPGSTGTA